jgi:hypothetical protein
VECDEWPLIEDNKVRFGVFTEAIRSSDTLFLTRATWRNIPEDGVLNFKRFEHTKMNNRLFLRIRTE